MKNYRCRVEECQKAFSDAASKIRHEKNVHGILPSRTRRNRSASVQEYREENVVSEAEESDFRMDSSPTPIGYSGPPPTDDKWSEARLENVSPYTLVPSDFFVNRSPSFAHITAPVPPPSPTPSNYTTISTTITDTSQNAPEESLRSLDTRADETILPKSLFAAFTSRNRAFSAPNIFISDNDHSAGRSPSLQDAIVSKHHSVGVESFVADKKASPENSRDTFDTTVTEPQIRLRGIDDLLRGPSAPKYQVDAQKQKAQQHRPSSPHQILSSSTVAPALQGTRPRSRSAVVDLHHPVDGPENTSATRAPRSRSSNTPPRRVNTRPASVTHFSPYGASAERERRQRPTVGNRARAYSDVFTPSPTRPIGILEGSTLHMRNDRYHAYRPSTAEGGNTDEHKCVSTRSPSVANPLSESRDPLFGALMRRPSISASPPGQPSINLASPQITTRNEHLQANCSAREAREASDHAYLEQRGHELFISTIITSEPLSPQEGANCRILRSDGRIVPARLVEKHVTVSDE